MKKAKRTPWIDSDIKPAIPGVYERKHGSCVLFGLWNGHHWRGPALTPLQATELLYHQYYGQHYLWRGLAEDPNKQAKKRK